MAWARMRASFGLATPLVAFFLLQNVMSLVSLAMVGRLGDAALAGVGAASALYGMLLALLFGVDAGVQVVVAQRYGAGDRVGAGRVLGEGILISAIVGALLMALGWLVGPWALRELVADPAAAQAGLAFLKGASPSLVIVGVSLAFSAYWNGSGAPRRSLAAMVVQAPCHALASYGLIFGAFGLPSLGTAGAGLGGALGATAALLVHLVVGFRIAPVEGLWRRPTPGGVARLVGLGLPVSLQQSLVYVGMALAYAIVAQVGVTQVAAANVVWSMMLLGILPAVAFGTAATTFVGQAFGRGDLADARRWGWAASWAGALAVTPVGLGLALAPEPALALFIQEPATRAAAELPLRILGLGMSLDAFGRILSFALRGVGATRTATVVPLLGQWAFQLPLNWWVAVPLGYGLVGISVVQLARSLIEAAVLAFIWRWGAWRRQARPAGHKPKRTLILSLLAALAGGSAAQAAEPALGYVFSTVSVASEHRYDGASSSNRKPVAQASVYLWRPDKLYAGVFVTGVDYGYEGSPSVEIDLYAGRHVDLDKRTRLSLQALYSIYPDRSGWGPTYDFLQLSTKVKRQVGKVAVTGALDVTPHGSFASGQGWRVSAEAVYPVAQWLTVSGRVAHKESHRGPPRNSWDLGATFKRGPVSLDVRYYDTNLDPSQCYGTDWCEPAVVGKLSYDLPFGHP